MPQRTVSTLLRVDHPEDLTPEERGYYCEVWGFDPVSDKNLPPPVIDTEAGEKPIEFYYQTEISLEGDPDLKKLGIELYIQVLLYSEGQCKCALILCCGKEEAEIQERFSELGDNFDEILVKALQGRWASVDESSVRVFPWVRFAALKALTEDLVKDGFLEGISHQHPLFFTHVLRGLREVRVEGICPVLEAQVNHLIQKESPEWFAERWMLQVDGERELERAYSLEEHVFSNMPYLESLDTATRVKWLRVLLAMFNYEEDSERAVGEEVVQEYSPNILWLTVTGDTINMLDDKTITQMLEEYLDPSRGRPKEIMRPFIPHLLKLARFLLPWGIDLLRLEELEEEWKSVNPSE